MPAPSIPVGIDLGTTFSVVAYLDATGRPCTIPNSEGDPITPSVVLFDGDMVVVGYAEELIKRLNAENELAGAAAIARRQIWSSVVALSDDDAVKKLGDLERGRSIYLPELDKTTEKTP